ncbi:heavy-metal-associated domain-containing protein [Gemmobacter sp.]|uniref:heavy-metal-associated domain-containing protein n=1 Tax=Gemmobacter sp. TaxID=1898957 RepID=UPI002AFE6DB8|nr:heavy-metal-associated domain-containing protein [Gemmobacter sp.]
MNLSIPDMNCGHCRASVTRALTELDPQAKVAVDLTARTAQVETTAPLPAVIAALDAVGFAATPA